MFTIKPIENTQQYITISPTPPTALKPDQTIRAKVLSQNQDGSYTLLLGGAKVTVQSRLKLSLNQTLLLQVSELSKNRVQLKIVATYPKYSDLSFLQKLDPMSIATLINFDEKLKQQIKKLRFDSTYYENISSHLQQINTILDKVKRIDPNLHKKIAQIIYIPPHIQNTREKITDLLNFQKLLRDLKDLVDTQDRPSAKLVQELLAMYQNYYLLGMLSNAYILTLPLAWENLEESTLTIKRVANAWICKVLLYFSDIKHISTTFILQKRYLKIYMAIEDGRFKEHVAANLDYLKSAYAGQNIYLRVELYEYMGENIENFLKASQMAKREA
ncbi:hypothetical protein [Nitratiruptor sp. YY09-18]|uniref:hypothetical protein n=1 Tax=Nitratiruptor sp. YY09-18 TaxID=2724901 RepID=UPI0019163AE0|nr:hypothetical protein [Nitratiruptor sp. YY09-18]BCD67795.1 hypothetical protein NitYY0918_C0702 [Nitratiruptor sp. YY09-18]